MSDNRLVKWDSLTKRLAGVAERECTDRGFAMLSIQILVDTTGQPVFWTEPTLTKLEPRVGATVFLDRILQIVARKEQL